MTSPRPRSPLVRSLLLALGGALVIASPAVGILPGPGGIFVFAAGLTLLLRNSLWVKRRFVLAKRRWPRLGGIADRALRRASAARRRARAAEAAR